MKRLGDKLLQKPEQKSWKLSHKNCFGAFVIVLTKCF